MVSRPYHKLLLLGLFASSPNVAAAQDLRYVTDLDIFTSLAGCAGDALSYVVMAQTYDNCPEGVTELQSCACTKDSNSARITASLSSSVSMGCGGTATEDQASVETVFSAYCNQDATVNFPTPTSPVSLYITDFPAWNDLAPCAADGLSYEVQAMTYETCPPDPEDLATCACQKNQNSLALSQGINTAVDRGCSSNDADRSSAQAVFSAYCGLNDDGDDSKFPTTEDPPGDMTYYVTALPEYNSLAPCAQSAVSYAIQAQTYEHCPPGPQALASCACIKEDVSLYISQSLTSSIGYNCGDTADEDQTSALAVYAQYCSAAKGKIVPTGVTESVSQPSQTETPLTPGGGGGFDFPTETGFSSFTSSAPTSTSTGDSGNLFDDWLGDSNDLDKQNGGGGRGGTANKIGAIVGGVVGGIAFLVLVGLGIFFGVYRGGRSWGRERNNVGVVGGGGGMMGGGNNGMGGVGAAASGAGVGTGSGEKVNNAVVVEDNRPVSPVSSTTAAGTVSAVGGGGGGRVSPIQQQEGMGELQGQHAFAPGAVVGAKELEGKQQKGGVSRKPVGVAQEATSHPYAPKEVDGRAIGQVQQQQQQQWSEVDDGTPRVEAGGFSRSELPGGGVVWNTQQQQHQKHQQYEVDDGTPRVEAGGNSRSELPGADNEWNQEKQQQQQEYQQRMRKQQMQQYQKFQQQPGQENMTATAGPGMSWDGGYRG